MFALVVTTEVGDGATTRFWTDRWLNGRTVADVAPALLAHVKKGTIRTRTVEQAMQNNSWRHDLSQGLPLAAVWEYLQLWDAL